MGSSSKLRTVICLLRNDLRIHDNEALLWAHNNADHVVPLYCFDPEHFKVGTWHFKFAKTGVHRANFILESIADLRKGLRRINSELVVTKDTKPSEAVKRIVEVCSNLSAPVSALVFQKEITYEELNVEKEVRSVCKSKGVTVNEVWGLSLYHAKDLPFKRVPDTYTQFRKEVEGSCRVRPLLQMPDRLKPMPPSFPTTAISEPELPDLPTLLDDPKAKPTKDPRTVFPFSGGESAGLDRLHEYLWGTHAVSTYKETRNGFLGTNYSTKFSTWLATGSLSPRKIFWEIKKYEKTEVANNSTYWVIFELIWRDYFKFVCSYYGDRVFYLSGIMNKKDQVWSQDMNKFNAWKEGRTGVPFIDANMRELKETGWMSNRGRQNVASFLIKDLGLDWRLGAEWFESQLLDHDVCSNYGNWNYAAGIGNDPRENRKFNIVKQGLDYDADGDYVRIWVPEVAGIRDGRVHHPWTMSANDLAKAGVEFDVSYPKAIHVAPEWSRHTHKKVNPAADRAKKQKGIDFYFKSQPSTSTDNSGSGSKSEEQQQANPKKRFKNKGSRIQH